MQARISRARITFVVICALVLMCATTSAQSAENEVGVIVDYGDESITWIWIPFAEEETPLIDLLEMTDLQMVTVGFGGMGEGVCQIDDTGCPAADCRQRLCQTSSSSPFWRIMELRDGEWSMTGSGVSGIRVEDGDIYSLSWSAENPDLPIVSMDELAANAGADRAANPLVPALRTDGVGETADEQQSWLPAIGATVVVLAAGVVLVLRSRRVRGDQP